MWLLLLKTRFVQILLSCGLNAFVFSTGLDKRDITYINYLYKSISSCSKINSLQPGFHEPDMVTYVQRLSVCFNLMWKPCLMKQKISPVSSLQSESFFPCNKGITVDTDQHYMYTVNVPKSFHFNLTFVTFSLQRSYRFCKIHRVTVSLYQD